MHIRLWAVVLLLAPVAGWTQQDDDERRAAENRAVLAELPDGPGKHILQQRCVDCHGLGRVASGHKNKQMWSNAIQAMGMNGAKIEPDEIGPLAEFLAAHFGLAVNVNTANAAELAKIPVLDERLGAAIVAYREKNGAFTSVEELTKVDGFSSELLDKIRKRVTVGVSAKKPQ